MTFTRPPAFFVGEHRALDFLNTTATPGGVRVEWLADGKDLIEWLEQAGSIEAAAAASIKDWEGDALDDVARQAREFRGWLREFVTARSRENRSARPRPLSPRSTNCWPRIIPSVGWRPLGVTRKPVAACCCAQSLPLGESRGVTSPDRRSGGGLDLQSGFSTDPVVRGFGLHAAVPRPHEGPRPALVQHVSLRQPGEGGGASGQEGCGMKRMFVSLSEEERTCADRECRVEAGKIAENLAYVLPTTRLEGDGCRCTAPSGTPRRLVEWLNGRPPMGDGSVVAWTSFPWISYVKCPPPTRPSGPRQESRSRGAR